MGIQTIVLQQGLVRASLNNPPFIQNQDPVRLLNSGQAVRNYSLSEIRNENGAQVPNKFC